jgi:hypothetical protein
MLPIVLQMRPNIRTSKSMFLFSQLGMLLAHCQPKQQFLSYSYNHPGLQQGPHVDRLCGENKSLEEPTELQAGQLTQDSRSTSTINLHTAHTLAKPYLAAASSPAGYLSPSTPSLPSASAPPQQPRELCAFPPRHVPAQPPRASPRPSVRPFRRRSGFGRPRVS